VTPSRLLLAAPRGYCAGVDRAVQTVEHALELAEGQPVYVRKEIVHNLHVVRNLTGRGAVFVDSELNVPEGETVILSAHGSAPVVYENAAARRLDVIDATCPLVTKVHNEVKRYVAAGYRMVLIGHEGHEEVIGTMGEAPEAITLVGSVAEVADLPELAPGEKLAYVTQTTLSVDETQMIIAALVARFPEIHRPAREDICYATSNRQRAVKELAREAQLVLVIGSRNSSNSCRLVEVACDHGASSHLIEDASGIDEAWIEGVDTVGITSGASAPEHLVQGVIDWFAARGVTEVEVLEVVGEDVVFNLPKPIRRALAAR
jgi:4-hydroxy-3-methylbut-2-enyl diphosphate reductase